MNSQFKLKNLYMKNLLSHEETKINFDEIDNFILIHGRDLDKGTYAGAGKSCVENAISFALFGKAFRGQTSGSINNEKLVSNWARGTKDPLIIRMILSNGKDEIEIERRMVFGNPQGTSTSLLINGESPKQFTTPQAPAKFLTDKIIQMDYKTFSKIHSFRTGNQVQFFSLRGMEQIDIMEKFVSKVNFSDMSKIISEDIQILSEKIEVVRRDRSLLENQLESLAQHETEYVSSQKEKFEERMEDSEKRLSENKVKLDSVIEELDKFKINRDKIETLKKKLKQLEKEMRKEGNSIKSKRKKILDFGNLLKNDQCPTCYQEINTELIQRIISGEEEEIRGSTKKIREMKEKYDSQNDVYKKIQERLEKFDARRLSLLQKKSKYETKTNFYVRDVKDCKKEMKKLETSSPRHYKKTRKDLKFKLTQTKKLLTRKENEKKRLKICFDSLKKKSPLKQYILQPLMPLFSNLMNKYFPILWGSGIEGEVIITPSNNVEFQIHKGYSAGEYESASSGECRIIDIAALLSFIEFANTINRTTVGFMVLDEILESMDKVLAVKVVNLLKEFAIRKNIQILFITNNSIIIENQKKYGMFDKELVFQKKQGKTTLLDNPEDVVEFDEITV